MWNTTFQRKNSLMELLIVLQHQLSKLLVIALLSFNNDRTCVGGEFGNHSALLIEELYRSRAEEVKLIFRLKATCLMSWKKNRLKGQKYSPRSTKTNELMYSTAKDRVRAFSVGHKTFEGFKIRKFRNVPCRTDHKNSEYIRTSILHQYENFKNCFAIGSQMQSDKASTIYKLSSLPNGSADKRTNEVISITNQNVEWLWDEYMVEVLIRIL